ncbi:MAG: hypothetical protein JO141_28635, partial [Bradyrhizobium sp.]|nr:hypothetical protein [Bradyrhizobium sp.]
KTEPSRPVLVATAHHDAETPERSFVGTLRPRIESDLEADDMRDMHVTR